MKSSTLKIVGYVLIATAQVMFVAYVDYQIRMDTAVECTRLNHPPKTVPHGQYIPPSEYSRASSEYETIL